MLELFLQYAYSYCSYCTVPGTCDMFWIWDTSSRGKAWRRRLLLPRHFVLHAENFPRQEISAKNAVLVAASAMHTAMLHYMPESTHFGRITSWCVQRSFAESWNKFPFFLDVIKQTTTSQIAFNLFLWIFLFFYLPKKTCTTGDLTLLLHLHACGLSLPLALERRN